MSDSSPCPPEKTIADFATGRLSGDEYEACRIHLEVCDKCREAMEWVNFHFPPGDDSAANSASTVAVSGRPSASLDPAAHVTDAHSIGTHGAEAYDSDAPDDALTESNYSEYFDVSGLGPSNFPSALGKFGNYDVVSIIGAGGMGVVFKAHDERLCRFVAIKTLNRKLAANPTACRRFLREARAAAAIKHPNVITIHSVDEHRSQPFLVMEHVEGCSLRDRLRKRRGRLDPLTVLRVSEQIAEGLEAAHAQGIIHRDVKPANIMLEDSVERVKITDFGFARAAVDNVELTSRDLAVGTPAYMSPEQVNGERIDLRADLFGLGCVIYCMLVGHSPFHGRSALEVIRKVVDEQPVAPHELNPETPRFLSEIVMRLLEKNPDRRYQTAAEVAAVVRGHLAILNQTPTDELNEVLSGRRSATYRGRLRRAAYVVGVALLCVGVALIARDRYLARKVALSAKDVNTSTDVPNSFAATAGVNSADNEQQTDGREKSPGPLAANWLTGTLSVSQSGTAQFTSIKAALARAGPGTTIRVEDDATYEEPLVVDNSRQWRGVTLESPRGATLAAPGTTNVLAIIEVPGVAIKGFRFRTGKAQHGIHVRGVCEGLRLESLEAVQPPGAERSFIVFLDVSGTEAAPIVVTGLKLKCGQIGAFHHGQSSPVRHVRYERSQFSGYETGTLLILRDDVADFHVTDSVFTSAVAGISLKMTSERAHRLSIENNTFLGLDHWLRLDEASLDQGEIRLRNNLMLKCIDIGKVDLAPVASTWFSSNWWEILAGDSATDRDQANLVARWRGDARVQCDPESANFARPLPDSPLNTLTDLDGNRVRIGAFGPSSGIAEVETAGGDGTRCDFSRVEL